MIVPLKNSSSSSHFVQHFVQHFVHILPNLIHRFKIHRSELLGRLQSAELLGRLQSEHAITAGLKIVPNCQSARVALARQTSAVAPARRGLQRERDLDA